MPTDSVLWFQDATEIAVGAQPPLRERHPSIGDDFLGTGVLTMLWTIFVILLVLWLLGVVTSYTLGGFIHILLVLAVIALIFQLLSGRRVPEGLYSGSTQQKKNRTP